jgi:hypothetical protein
VRGHVGSAGLHLHLVVVLHLDLLEQQVRVPRLGARKT